MNLHDLRKLHDALESILNGSVSDLIDMTPEESAQRLQGFDSIIAGFGIRRVTIEDKIRASIKEDMSRHAATRPQQDNSKRVMGDDGCIPRKAKEDFRHEGDF